MSPCPSAAFRLLLPLALLSGACRGHPAAHPPLPDTLDAAPAPALRAPDAPAFGAGLDLARLPEAPAPDAAASELSTVVARARARVVSVVAGRPAEEAVAIVQIGSAPREHALGSGFVITADGLVMTSRHVIDGADDVHVEMDDGRCFPASVVARDAVLDIALLRLAGARGLPVAVLGASASLRVGDPVIAMGNPFGIGPSVRRGILSAEAREVDEGPTGEYLQTDAAVNPGDSGGPLLDRAGRVVGVNTAIISHGQGISFAVPIDDVRAVLDELTATGRVNRGHIGITYQPVNAGLVRALSLPGKEGTLVTDIEHDGPAERAGLRPGDLIVSIDGRAIHTVGDLSHQLERRKPGEVVRVGVQRADARHFLPVLLDRIPNRDGDVERPARAARRRRRRPALRRRRRGRPRPRPRPGDLRRRRPPPRRPRGRGEPPPRQARRGRGEADLDRAPPGGGAPARAPGGGVPLRGGRPGLVTDAAQRGRRGASHHSPRDLPGARARPRYGAGAMTSKTSSLPGFRDLDLASRRRAIGENLGLAPGDLDEALEGGGLAPETADKMIENAIGTLALPFGVALNVRVNGADYLVPMAIEEPSVVAAASHAAKRVRAGGGFVATATEPLMAAQIEVHDVADPAGAVARVREARAELLAAAARAVPGIVERGGGPREIEVRDLGSGYVVTQILVDVRDAMGANMLNTVAEAVGDRVAELCAGTLGLRILTNYCDRRLTRVTARNPVADFACRRASGPEAAAGVASASRFAELDPYRAVTHNKGIMNGVDAVVLATGNDWRAVEAAAHAYAARSGRYAPLATWKLVDGGAVLEGRIELPLALGTVGGALRAHTGARLALDLLGVTESAELAMVAAAAGLATNLAALRAMATEGIQRGHMALHHRTTQPPPSGTPR